MREGATLEEALEGCLEDLDGFYTFAVGTADGFAVLRDPIACKPAVMAENDDWVAMASEYRAIAVLPGAADAETWEPEPGASTAGVRRRWRDGHADASPEALSVDLATETVRALNERLHALTRRRRRVRAQPARQAQHRGGTRRALRGRNRRTRRLLLRRA